jgi:hypothetical protein
MLYMGSKMTATPGFKQMLHLCYNIDAYVAMIRLLMHVLLTGWIQLLLHAASDTCCSINVLHAFSSREERLNPNLLLPSHSEKLWVGQTRINSTLPTQQP